MFRSTLLLTETPELAILILSGDGTSESLQAERESDATFIEFLDEHLPEKIDTVVDAEYLTFAGSLLLGVLGDLYYQRTKNDSLFVTGGDLEVQKKLEQLIKLYNIEEHKFIHLLDKALATFELPPRMKDEIFLEKIEIGGPPIFSPEINFIRRALGKGDQIDDEITRSRDHLEKLYREGLFRLGDMDNIMVLSAPMFQLIAFLYLRDVLSKFNLYSGAHDEKGKFNQSELEWIVHEIIENSRIHGYGMSDFGIIFVHFRMEKDYLSLIFEDHGSGKTSATAPGAKRAHIGIQNLLLEKFSPDAYRQIANPLQFDKSAHYSRHETRQRTDKAATLIQYLLHQESPAEKIGPGYQLTINIPLPQDG